MKTKTIAIALASAALLIGANPASATVTPYAWYHAGENGTTVDSAPGDPSNAHAINKAFGHGSSVYIYLAPRGAGGPLGPSGYISTQSTLFGNGHTDANGEWIGGTVNGSDAVPTLAQWNFNYTNWIMECWILPIGNGCLNGPPFGSQRHSQFLCTGSDEYGAQPGGARFVIDDDALGNSNSIQITAQAIGPQTANNFNIGDSVTLDTNRWMHLAVVVDSSSGNAISTFYVNGVRHGASTTNGLDAAGHLIVPAVPPTVPYFGSGRDTPQPYWGYLDEMRFSSFSPGQFSTNDLLIRANAGPSITGQPQSPTVWAGGAAPFSITTVFDTSTTYQWRRGGVPIPSATAQRYVKDPVVVGDSGAQFDCVVTASSISVTSAPATLTVLANNPSNVAAYRNLVTSNPNLVGYYPVDNSSGSIIADTVNSSFNGALELGAYFDGRTNSSFGQRGVSFNGDGDVQIPNNPAYEFSSGNGTIEAVIYEDPAGQFVATDHTIVSETADSDPRSPYYFLRASANGSSLIYGNDSTPSVSWIMPANLLGQPTHVALVFQNGASVTAYVNGINLGTKTQNSFGSSPGSPLWIGSVGTSAPDNWWYGEVDELAFYSAALSQTTIQQHYSSYFFGTNTSAPSIVSQPSSRTVLAGASPTLAVKAGGTLPLTYQWKSNNVVIPGATSASLQLSNLTTTATFILNIQNAYGQTNSQPIVLTTTAPPAGYLSKIMPDGPIALWRLAETSGTVAVDSAGFNDGAYSGGVTLGGSSFPNEPAPSAKFNGSDGRAVVPSLAGPAASALNLPGSFTIEYWAEADAVGFNVPVSSMNRPSRDSGYEFYLQGNFGGFEWHVGPGGYNALVGENDVPALGAWYHIVATFDSSDGANGSIHMYINGQEDDSGGGGNSALPNAYVPNAIKPFYIGSRSDDSHFWNGSLADVALYNYVLSPAQIANHYSVTAAGAAITQQPVGGTFPEGAASVITLTAAASGQPNSYQWVKDGVDLTAASNSDGTDHYPAVSGGFNTILQGVNGPKLVINQATPADSGTYHLVVSNPIHGVQTINVQVIVSPNTIAPKIASVTGLGTSTLSGTPPNPNLVKVMFSARVDAATGGDLTKYTFNPPVTVSSMTLLGSGPHDLATASLGGDWREAILVTSGLIPGQKYSLTVSGVKDQSQTPVTMPPTTAYFRAPLLTAGVLDWDYYYLGSGGGVFTLTADANYLSSASQTNAYLTAFDSDQITGGDLNNNPSFGSLGDNYGSVLSGWITPTVAGDYTFFLASDDASELDLSPDANPANATMIAQELGCCHGFTEPPVAYTSDPQTLQAGVSYFIRAYHVEGGGGDYVKVAWRLSTDSTPAANLPPIQSSVLSAYKPVPPPQFSTPLLSGGNLTISWSGYQATLQQSTDLVNWTAVAGNPNPLIVPVSSAPRKFYRLVQ
jgi:hypothetical protein